MLFADSPEACPYGFHRFVIFDQTDKPQFTNNTAPNEAVLSCKVENQTFIFPDHSKSLMNRPPMTVRFWKWM
jgi:hypothetical protein